MAVVSVTLLLLLWHVSISHAWSEWKCTNLHGCPELKMYESAEEYRSVYGETETMAIRVNLITAARQNGAVCLDGTVPVFYYRPGSGNGANKFHVFFQGGGWCAGNGEAVAECMDTCQHRATTELGSSLFDSEFAGFDQTYMSTSAAINPLSYNWNTVYVRYCDGYSFSGNNDTVLKGDIDLHFRGWRILNAVFEELQANFGWSARTDVLVSGCSAGGLTTWLHSDYIYETYAKPANFLSMPDSGFFVQYEGAGRYVSGLTWNYNWANGSEAMNKKCMADKTPQTEYLCTFAQETARYVQVKMFPLQSRFDSWQTGQELRSDNSTLINAYGQNMTTLFNQYIQSNAKHSGFFDSCHHHCGEWNSIVIDGYTASQAQVEVYYNNADAEGRLWFQADIYPCSVCCSP